MEETNLEQLKSDEDLDLDPDLVEGLLENVQNRDRAEKWRTKILTLYSRVENASPENFQDVSRDIERDIDQVDDFLTALQEQKDSFKEERDRLLDQLPMDKVEETAGQYTLTIKEPHELGERISDLQEQIDNWKDYLVILGSLNAKLNKEIAVSLFGDRVDKQASEKILQFAEKKHDELDQRVEKMEDRVVESTESKLDRRLSEELGDIKMAQATMQKELEFFRENFGRLVDTLRTVSDAQKQVAKLVQVIDEQTDIDADEAREMAEKASEETSGATDRLEDPEGAAVERAREEMDDSIDPTPPLNEAGEDGDVDESAEGEESAEEELDDAERDERPSYSLKHKSLSEMKAEFDRMEENEDPDDLSFQNMAEKSDVSHETIRNKLNKVREEYGDDVCFPLGNP